MCALPPLKSIFPAAISWHFPIVIEIFLLNKYIYMWVFTKKESNLWLSLA